MDEPGDRDPRRSLHAAARLLRYEAGILRSSFAAAFSGWRDRILLAIVALLALAWLRSAATHAAAPDPRLVAGAAAAIGWLLVRALRRRLSHLASESALAAEALDPGARRLAGAVITAAAVLPLLVVTGVTIPGSVPAGLAALAAGAIAAAVLPLFAAEGRLKLARSRLAPNPLPGWRTKAMVAPVILAAATALVARLWLGRGEDAAALAAGGAALAASAWLIRPDAAVARFLALAGFGPWRSALHQLAPATLYAFAAPAMVRLAAGPLPALAALLVVAFLLALDLIRAWLFRLHHRRAADTILVLAVAALAAVTIAAPPLGLLLGLGMAVSLYRRAADARWRLD